MTRKAKHFFTQLFLCGWHRGKNVAEHVSVKVAIDLELKRLWVCLQQPFVQDILHFLDQLAISISIWEGGSVFTAASCWASLHFSIPTRVLYVYPAAYPASLYQAAYPNPVPQVHIQPALALKQDHKTPCVGKYQIGILGPVKIRVFFDLPLWRWMFWAKWLNKNIFLSNKNRDYDMQVKLQIYEGGSELERDHTGNGYKPDKNENQGFD